MNYEMMKWTKKWWNEEWNNETIKGLRVWNTQMAKCIVIWWNEHSRKKGWVIMKRKCANVNEYVYNMIWG